MSEFLIEPGPNAHALLVELAQKWLMGAGKCVVSATEIQTWTNMEIPDAIGFDYTGRCTIVECKVSRSDFLSDKKKRFRKMPEMGMGAKRYFLTQKGLIGPAELPERWGLIYVYPKVVKCVKQARPFDDRNIYAERRCMVKMMRAGSFKATPVY